MKTLTGLAIWVIGTALDAAMALTCALRRNTAVRRQATSRRPPPRTIVAMDEGDE